MSERVNIPVECLGPMCKNCSELEIDIYQTEISNGIYTSFINDCKCKHLNRCCGIYSLVKRDWEENNVTRLEHRP